MTTERSRSSPVLVTATEGSTARTTDARPESVRLSPMVLHFKGCPAGPSSKTTDADCTCHSRRISSAPLTCADCPLPYGDPGWCDAVVPDDVWAKIAPRESGGGVLCFSCMARRLVALGLENVPLTLASGPFAVPTSLWEDGEAYD